MEIPPKPLPRIRSRPSLTSSQTTSENGFNKFDYQKDEHALLEETSPSLCIDMENSPKPVPRTRLLPSLISSQTTSAFENGFNKFEDQKDDPVVIERTSPSLHFDMQSSPKPRPRTKLLPSLMSIQTTSAFENGFNKLEDQKDKPLLLERTPERPPPSLRKLIDPLYQSTFFRSTGKLGYAEKRRLNMNLFAKNESPEHNRKYSDNDDWC